MAKKRIGILGGTFNPIHEGHLHMASAALEELELDRVLVLPTGNPPHKKDVAPGEDRWKMVCAACANREGLEPCRLELDRSGIIYTVDTLSILTEMYPKAELYYIIGADTLMELQKWRDYQRVLTLCTFAVCPRPWHYTAAELQKERRRLTSLGGSIRMLSIEELDASSTDIRAALARGERPDTLPVPLYEYCGARGLYGMPARILRSEEWLARLFHALSAKRFAHTLAVAHTARELALLHGLDARKAEIAALLHDCAKCLPLKEMQAISRAHSLTGDAALESSGNLLHSVTGAYLAGAEYGVNDPDVLHAIACHTTGQPGMSRLDMAVYLADKIEPTRAPYPQLEAVRALARHSLEQAMLLSMEGTSKYVRKGGKPLHPTTLETIAWLHTLPETAPSQA